MEMRAITLSFLLFSSAAAAQECDWKIASDKIDPMTDKRRCTIVSHTAKIGVGVDAGAVTFASMSVYRNGRDGLTLRVDDNEAIFVGKHSSTADYEDNARRALAEIMKGKRLRTRFSNYPNTVDGEVQICNLPALIAGCQGEQTASAAP